MQNKITTKTLYQQVIQEIELRMGMNTKSPYSNQLSKSQITNSATSAPTNIVDDIIANLRDVLHNYIGGKIVEGLYVTAFNDDKIRIEAGSGVILDTVYTLEDDVFLDVPFDLAPVIYVTLYRDQVEFATQESGKKLSIAKIIIPKPGFTTVIEDVKNQVDTWNAYILNLRPVVFYQDGYGNLEDDSVEFLRNNIGKILADNIIGNIRLSEDLKITNTQGTVEIDSKSLNIFDENGNIIAKYNKDGSYLYNNAGQELAKFTTTEARVGGMRLTPTTIESSNFVSGSLGAGFQINHEGDAEFGNVKVRGKLSSSVFEKETISAIGGSLLIMDSDILEVDMTAEDASPLTISGDTTFAIGDFLRIKDGTEDEWFEVTGVSNDTYTVTRDKASSYTSDNNPVWKKGTAVVNYGQSGEGGIYMTASETNAPYLSILSHAGSPWTSITTQLRLGNLNGFLGYTEDKYGIGIGSSDSYLKYDEDDGLQIKGDITVTGGNASVTFYQAGEPGASGDLGLPKAGDYWVDTDDSNALYTYQGGVWVSAQYITTSMTTFYQEEPPNALVIGDLWIDTNDGNKLYRASATGTGDWVEVQDEAIATALGDAADAQSTADGKIITFYQTEPPTSVAIGDLWVDTDDGNKLYRAAATGTGDWVEIQDDEIAQAISDASTAQNTADSKIVTFRQAGVPTAITAGDTWFNTGNSRIYRATAIGDDEITPGEWEALQTAIGIPATAGLYLGSDYLGYSDGDEWNAYIDCDGNVRFGNYAEGSYMDYSAATCTFSVQSSGVGCCVEITGGNITANSMKVVDPDCDCCYSYLSAGSWYFHDTMGNSVPYVRRICQDVVNAGATVVLQHWASAPSIQVGIQELTSYNCDYSTSCQKWCLYHDNLTFYCESGLDWGYCFDVHAALFKGAGVYDECIVNEAFGTCCMTHADTCCSLIKTKFALWKTDALPASCYCYGYLTYRVNFKKNVGGCTWQCCDIIYEHPHSTIVELKQQCYNCVCVDFGSNGEWEIYLSCLSLVWCNTTLCQSTSEPCCRTFTGSCGIDAFAEANAGDSDKICTNCTTVAFNGTSPSNVYCTYLCVCYQSDPSWACQRSQDTVQEGWSCLAICGTDVYCKWGEAYNDCTYCGYGDAAAYYCCDLSVYNACAIADAILCICLHAKSGNHPTNCGQVCGTSCVLSGYLMQCYLAFDDNVTCEYELFYSMKDTTGADTILDAAGVVSYIAVAYS